MKTNFQRLLRKCDETPALMTSTKGVTTNKSFREEAIEIFKSGKFESRKWQSNKETLNDCDLPNKTKLLGLNWDKRKDALTFTFNKEIKPVTQQDVLHTVNSIYDPLSLIEPLKIIDKHLYRDACDIERCWDKVLPPKFQNQWKGWIHGLDTVCIPRSITNVLQPVKYINLHMFGDSSRIASATTRIAVIKVCQKIVYV